MFKNAKVIPLSKETNIIPKSLRLGGNNVILGHIDNSSYTNMISKPEYYHLYIISDDKIEEGDYVNPSSLAVVAQLRGSLGISQDNILEWKVL